MATSNTINLLLTHTSYTAASPVTAGDTVVGAKPSDLLSNLTVNGTTQSDTINLTNQTAGTNAIYGNGGGDQITLGGAGTNNTVTAGAGGASVSLGGGHDTIVYKAGDGALNLDANTTAFSSANDKIQIGYNAADLAFATSADGKTDTITGASGDKIIISNLNLTAGTGLASLNSAITTADGISKFYFTNGGSAVGFDATMGPQNAAAANGAYEIGNASVSNTFDYYGTEKFIRGGSGTADAVVAQGTTGMTIDLSDTTKFKSIEDATGTAGNDILRGNAAGGDSLNGGAGGNDQFWGHGGNNTTMTGSTGNDTFYFGTGDQNDTVNGGTGNDVIDLYNVNASQLNITTLGGSSLNVAINGDITDNLVVNDPFADVTFVTKDNAAGFKVGVGDTTVGSNTGVYLGTGTSKLTTDGKGDTITLSNTALYKGYNYVKSAATGNDILRGTGSTNVTLDGSADAGNVQLWGGAGLSSDSLAGGTGNSTYYFGAGNGNDTVTVNAGATGQNVLDIYNVNAGNLTYRFSGGVLTANIKGDSSDSLAVTTNGKTLKVVTADNANGVNVATGSATYNSNVGLYVGAGTDTLTTDGKGDTISLYNTAEYLGYKKIASVGGNDVLRGIGTTGVSLDGSANITGSLQFWGGNGAGSDTITGGCGKDTFYFGTGNGADSITQQANAVDVVDLYNLASSQLSYGYAGGALTITNTQNAAEKLTINNWTNDSAHTTFVTSDNSTGFKLAVDTGSNSVTYAANTRYVGDGTTTLDGSAQTAGITVNLYDTTQYTGIDTVVGGSGNDILRGIASATTDLQGGSGSDQLWANLSAINSTLDGGGDTATDTYYYGKQGGTVKVQNYGTEDTIKLYNANASDLQFGVSGSDLTVKFAGDATDTLTLSSYTSNPLFVTADNAKGFKVVESSTGTLTYDSAANYYLNDAATATVDASTQTSGVMIDLSNTTKYQNLAGGTIDTIVGGAGADTLRGNSDANKITAGNGGAQLWGGLGGYSNTDTLVGGTGADTFWFGTDGAKADVVTGNASDKVFLYSAGMTAANAGITVEADGTTVDIAFGTGANAYTLKLANELSGGAISSTAVNSFAFGRTATSDNTYKLALSGGQYSLVKA